MCWRGKQRESSGLYPQQGHKGRGTRNEKEVQVGSYAEEQGTEKGHLLFPHLWGSRKSKRKKEVCEISEANNVNPECQPRVPTLPKPRQPQLHPHPQSLPSKRPRFTASQLISADENAKYTGFGGWKFWTHVKSSTKFYRSWSSLMRFLSTDSPVEANQIRYINSIERSE